MPIDTNTIKEQPKIDIDLLLEITAKATEHPVSFNMDHWGVTRAKSTDHPCGMVGCLGGTALFLRKPERFFELVKDMTAAKGHYERSLVSEAFMREASLLVGLTGFEAEQLFHVEGWPDFYRRQYAYAATSRDRAEATKAYVNFFITEKRLQGRAK